VGSGRGGKPGFLRAADRADHGGAGPAGELDHRVPHGAGAAGGKHHLAVEYAGAQAAGTVLGDGERAVRGERGDAERGADVEAGVVRQRHRLVGGYDGESGGGAGGAAAMNSHTR
jgi:hypothetical protein